MTEDDTNHLAIGIEDLDETHHCPVCGSVFDRETKEEQWSDEGGYHYRSGGKTDYGCPTEGCDGTIAVLI